MTESKAEMNHIEDFQPLNIKIAILYIPVCHSEIRFHEVNNGLKNLRTSILVISARAPSIQIGYLRDASIYQSCDWRKRNKSVNRFKAGYARV